MHVVIGSPRFNLALYIVDRQELVRVQTFIAQLPIERLDKACVRASWSPSPSALRASLWRTSKANLFQFRTDRKIGTQVSTVENTSRSDGKLVNERARNNP